MKEGRDEEKVMGPLFPRLHVNDTEKGGPRAPPRNKMALYEQLSIPSQRFNSSASTLPLPPHNTSTLVPSASSSRGGGHDRSMFSSFYMPSLTPAHSTEKVLYNSKNSSGKKFGDEDDFQVPTYVHTSSSDKNQNGPTKQQPTPFPMHQGQSAVKAANGLQGNMTVNPDSSVHLQNVCDKPLKWTNTTDLKSWQPERNQCEQTPKDMSTLKASADKSESQPSAGKKVLVQDHPRAMMNEYETAHTENTNSYHEASAEALPDNYTNHNVILIEPRCTENNIAAERANVPRVTGAFYSKTAINNGHGSPNEAEICSNEMHGPANWPAQVEDVDRNDDASETSMVDSISALDISPDDVVGVIGQRQFWKARKAIVNQQRLFSVQVFELHRLIKVQKLIAGSPHLLLENNAYPGRSSLKTMVKKPPPNSNTKAQPNTVKPRDEPQKPNQNSECTAENVVGKPPLPTLENSVNKGLVSQIPTRGPPGGNPSLTPMAADSRSSPWCVPPPGNQWLVPVMSPSEGLIYKPCMGPWPPAGGFMTPIYGGCGLLTLPPIPPYGVPASHQQPGIAVTSGAPAIAQNYCPTPYGLPGMNLVIPSSPAEQANLSSGPCFPGQVEQASTTEVNVNMHSRSLCNISNQKSEASSCHVPKVQVSKDAEFAVSTASSPSERPNGVENPGARGQDALPRFPVASAGREPCGIQQAHSGDQQTRVIKVVPHNRRTATESAARIFRSIQEERQKYESL